MKPRYDTHYTVEAIHPDKKEPFDTYINYYADEKRARAAVVELEKQGYEHISIRPPRT